MSATFIFLHMYLLPLTVHILSILERYNVYISVRYKVCLYICLCSFDVNVFKKENIILFLLYTYNKKCIYNRSIITVRFFHQSKFLSQYFILFDNTEDKIHKKKRKQQQNEFILLQRSKCKD